MSVNPSYISRSSRFFSITGSGDEVTLLLESSLFSQFSPEEIKRCQVNKSTWCVLEVSAGQSGIGVSGFYTEGLLLIGLGERTVYLISSALSRNGIPLYYLASSTDDYILVRFRVKSIHVSSKVRQVETHNLKVAQRVVTETL